ncbi:serine hydrolase [Paenibacillus sp.]|uniref:serine hydrolase domain-containing protein n=1 Tax=Paenibacillus sp. TaxID=58172 RepID=UPI002D4345D6|nr:serine hydrolase [Paenibacillus sp.]HZG85986.1 serine hydrolase [Paenibacillus sp.]
MNELLRVRPEEVGVNPSGILNFIRDIQDRNIPLHSFMLLRGGKVAAEAYYAPFRPELPHPIFSVSKSVTSAAVGIAIGEGLLSLDDNVVEFFPEKLHSAVHPYTAEMKIRHLLSMQTVHRKSTNKEAADIVQTYLLTPPSHPPGSVFAYDTTGTHTLCAILQKVADCTVHEYLEPRLFGPIGMRDVEWETCPMGINKGGSGIRCTTEDMARFGQLYLQEGRWNGIQVLPEGWVRQSTRRIVDTSNANMLLEGRRGYGYCFWMARAQSYCAFGAGGQFILVIPGKDAVFVTTANTMLNRDEHQLILDCFWANLYPSMPDGALAYDDANTALLEDKLSNLELVLPAGLPSSPLAARLQGRRFQLQDACLGADVCSFVFGDTASKLLFGQGDDAAAVSCGMNTWIVAQEPFYGMSAACAAVWTDESTLIVNIQLLEEQHMFILTCRFLEERFVLQIKPVGFVNSEPWDREWTGILMQ